MSDRSDIAYALMADAVDNHKPVTASATLRQAADLLDGNPQPPPRQRDPNHVPADPSLQARRAQEARERIRAARATNGAPDAVT